MPVSMKNPLDKLLHILPLLFLITSLATGAWLGLRKPSLDVLASVALPPGLSNLPADTVVDSPADPPAQATLHNPFPESSAEPEPLPGTAETAEPPLREVRLELVASGRHGQYAITNSSIMRPGDEGEGFTVVQIFPHGVLYTTGEEDFFLQPGEKVAIGKGQIVYEPAGTKKNQENEDR